MGSRKLLKGVLSRRQALTGAAATLGLGLALAPNTARAKERLARLLPSANACILTPQAMEGPFYFDPQLVRTDITEGKGGAPLRVTLKIFEAATCAPLPKARIDIWQCDGLGVYSGYARQATGSTRGQTFLRGTQFADDDGVARFDTIYPGWYPGRTPHIHFKVLLDKTSLVTGQLYFPDPVTDRIYASHAPNRQREEQRDTNNATDFIFADGGADTLLKLEGEGTGYAGSLVIGVGRTRQVRG
jgi:protocatechuate 3,4-dioxygenase beta subunit